ncbi:EF-hand domain-containing protein [Zobellia laminariae]|uniref:EF-hand domain-containing protein n=1 Tax=Zobellia laminariae TaxID=248906 RepID=UPI0026F43D80|nr:EF-hand domain-containing protein [Zobellia laminariae]WKX76820.1 EF-hand domain-containing protein [Zobellia laminariae]
MSAKAMLIGVTTIAIMAVSCKSQQASSEPAKQGPPSVDAIFTKMDSNKDGLLSKTEVNGPLKEKFTEIDTNKDGFLSKEEVKKGSKTIRKETSKTISV